MGADTKIQWAHHTFNPWRGCTKVSDGCKFCYADAQSVRNPKVLGVWGPNGTRVVAAEAYWKQAFAWNREAREAGERRRVFCASLADVFEAADTMPAAALPAVRAARVRLFDMIRTTPHLDWLLLTKRPENIRNVIEESLILCQGGDPDDKNYFSDRDGSFPEGELAWWLNNWTGDEPPANVWLGTSVENQQQLARAGELLKVPAAIRFLSMEPLLEAVDLRGKLLEWRRDGSSFFSPVPHSEPHRLIDLVIVGGESGPHARPCNVEWIRSIVEQCKAAGVACFVKQLGRSPFVTRDGKSWGQYPNELIHGDVFLNDKKGGEPSEWPEYLRVREMPAAPAESIA